MKATAASIRNLLVVVLVLSADFYLIRDCFDRNGLVPYFRWPPLFQAGFLGSLPMTNIVVVGGSVVLSRGEERRTFLAGFVLSGALAIAALLSLSIAIPPGWFAALDRPVAGIASWFDRQRWIVLDYQQSRIIYGLAFSAVLFTPPELLIATAGGLMARARSRAGHRAP